MKREKYRVTMMVVVVVSSALPCLNPAPSRRDGGRLSIDTLHSSGSGNGSKAGHAHTVSLVRSTGWRPIGTMYRKSLHYPASFALPIESTNQPTNGRVEERKKGLCNVG